MCLIYLIIFYAPLGSGRASAGPEGRNGPAGKKQDTPLHFDHTASNWQLPQQH